MKFSYRSLVLFGGGLLSLVLLAIAVSNLDWQAFLATLSTLKVAYAVPALPLILASIAVRTLRWAALNVRGGDVQRFWYAATVGYLGNYVYPLRAGEVARVVLISKLIPNISISQASASSLIDRALDLLVLLLAVTLITAFHELDGQFLEMLPRLLWGVGAALSLAFAILVFPNACSNLARRCLNQLPNVIAEPADRLLIQATSGLYLARRPKVIANAATLTLIAALLDYFTIWIVLKAFNWNLPFIAAITLGTFLQIGSVLPSAPGFVGVWQIASILALGLYGIGAEGAIAFSIVHQLFLFIVVISTGAWSAAAAGFSLSSLRHTESE